VRVGAAGRDAVPVTLEPGDVMIVDRSSLHGR
jgi:hypothetical protein